MTARCIRRNAPDSLAERSKLSCNMDLCLNFTAGGATVLAVTTLVWAWRRVGIGPTLAGPSELWMSELVNYCGVACTRYAAFNHAKRTLRAYLSDCDSARHATLQAARLVHGLPALSGEEAAKLRPQRALAGLTTAMAWEFLNQ